MRSLFVILTLCLASVEAFSQVDPPKDVYLEMTDMKQMVVVRDFRDVPSEVRDIQVKGYLLVKVKVDVTGNPVRVFAHKFKTAVAGEYDSLPEYVGKAVLNWTFKPLLIDGQAVPYQGYVWINFWYGAFVEEAPTNTSESLDLLRLTKRLCRLSDS